MRATGFSLVVKALIRDRAGGCCELCGYYSSDCVAHHRRARGMGSTKRPETNLPSNALWVCPEDHDRIESHRALAYDNGWLVHQGASPVDVPVLRRGEWVQLDDLGGVITVEPQEDSSIKTAAQVVKLGVAEGAINTPRPLTQPSDYAEGGLAVNASATIPDGAH